MEVYYDNNLSQKIYEIGNGHNKVWKKRMFKKAANWYFTNFYFNLIMSAMSTAGFIWGLLQ